MGRRLASAALVALLHLLTLYLLLLPGPAPFRREAPALTTFDVAPPPPPPPPRTIAPPSQSAKVPRAAGPAGRRAQRTPVVAPAPVVLLSPPPVTAATLADHGAAPVGGTAAAGNGTGAGIGGWGSGAGGTGSGGGGQRARLTAGKIEDRDYPPAARRARVEGIATVRFTVDPDGRARRCRVVRSAGDASLDTTTCRLIEERFRYAPALNGAGNAVAEERGWQQRWWLER